MTRLLLLGTGPLLAEGSKVMSGQCLRTWHFCKPLLEAGHQIRLLTVPIPGTTGADGDPIVVEEIYEGFSHGRLTRNDAETLLPHLRREIEAFRPQAVLGINAWPACLLARLHPDVPFWADLNGWTMAEGLARGAVVGHDNDFHHFWRMEVQTLLEADRFSTVTERQLDALQGEMAMIGAFSRHRVAEPIGTVVPNAVHPHFSSIKRAPAPPWLELPDNAWFALWSGGFNSWTDIPTLIEGFRRAFSADPRLNLVCTGGAVHGHDEKTWADFLNAANNAWPMDRVHLLGWCELEKVLDLHAAAAVGINMDGDNLETRFGARNRLTNMLGAGVPVVTTRGTEVAAWIQNRHAGEVIPMGDADALAGALLLHQPENLEIPPRSARAREVALEEFSPSITMEAVLAWATAPPAKTKKPDGGSPVASLASWMARECTAPHPFAPPPAPTTLSRRVANKIKRFLK